MSGDKLYSMIEGIIEDAVLSGVLREGDLAPSTHQLAERFKVNPATAARGVTLLTNGGILTVSRGIGVFVAEGAREKILQRRRDAFREAFIEPMLDEAKKLGIHKRDLLAVIMAEKA